jgi:hypothetical protein
MWGIGQHTVIHLIRSHASQQQIEEMLQALGTYIKLAVDIQRRVVAGGGALHADCEAILLEDGSRQEDVWGADWIPGAQQVTFESLINIRPRQNNPSLEILDSGIRDRVAEIVTPLLGGMWKIDRPFKNGIFVTPFPFA